MKKSILDHLPKTEDKFKTSVDVKTELHNKCMAKLHKNGKTFSELVESAQLQYLSEPVDIFAFKKKKAE